MFTGIVRELGRVALLERGAKDARLVVAAPDTAQGVAIGDSVSVSGVCLTVVAATNGTLAAGDAVNVEPALRAGDPLGGHYVQGHVDGVGRVRSVEEEGEGVRMWIDIPGELLRYLVEKGSVTVDGVSLTVAELDASGFAVALVPHTLTATTLGSRAAGGPVNLEVDVLAKYVERLVLR
jgi:riboflavin synthase